MNKEDKIKLIVERLKELLPKLNNKLNNKFNRDLYYLNIRILKELSLVDYKKYLNYERSDD